MTIGPRENRSQLVVDLTAYLDGLYSYAVILSRNRTQAEDLVQETCLRAIRAQERLRPDSNVKSWLFTILRNVWLNQVRQWRTAPEIVELDLDGDSGNKAVDTKRDPLATYLSNTERQQVRNAIQQLPLESREIILLREYEELSYEEIAVLLECPIGTVMSRLARARSKLRALLAATAGSPSATTGSNDTKQTWPERESAPEESISFRPRK